MLGIVPFSGDRSGRLAQPCCANAPFCKRGDATHGSQRAKALEPISIANSDHRVSIDIRAEYIDGSGFGFTTVDLVSGLCHHCSIGASYSTVQSNLNTKRLFFSTANEFTVSRP